MSDSACYPWWHQTFAPLANEGWTKAIIPSGCKIDSTGNIPCSIESMRASAERWLAHNAPQALVMIGGSLPQDVYTFARYMHSEVGSGTIEERVAVGEAGINQAKRRAGTLGSWRSKLNGMLIPNGMYGAIHAPDAYCASLGLKPGCNAAKRWAATSRDPSVMALLLAHLVVSGTSAGFAGNASTQWGPEYLKNPDGSRWNAGTTQERVASFVRYAASSSGGGYYWVGELPGVDPWHTWLAFKGPGPTSIAGQTLIARGVQALPINSSGMPIRRTWPDDLPPCGKPGAIETFIAKTHGAGFFMAALGLATGALAANWTARRYLRGPNE